MLDGYLPTKVISLTYKKLINKTPDPLRLVRERWERDGLVLDDEEWEEAVASPREVAISSRLCLIQLKILHRVCFWVPALQYG